MHQSIEPAVLYLGTPVVLVSTLNEDGTVNVAPMSSAWWLGWSCMLGFDASSKTVENLLREGECVLNLPSVDQVDHVDRLARLTGSDPAPRHKLMLGFRSERDKIGTSGLTLLPSEDIRTPRVAECPIQLEARLVQKHDFAADDPRFRIPAVAIEVRIHKVHAEEALMSSAYRNRIDPLRWKPLLMSFLRFFGVGSEVAPSRLAETPEEFWGGRRPEPLAGD